MATTTWKDFEKIAGTRVEEDGGKWVRKVKASGKVFAAKDVTGVKQHLAKIGEAVPAAKTGGKPATGETTWKSFEKIAGTRVEEEGGKWVRKVKASGKVFSAKDVVGVRAHLAKIGEAAPKKAEAGAKRKSKGGEEDGEGGGKKRKKGEKAEKAPEPTAEGLDADMDSYWSAKGAADAEPAAEEPAAEEPAAEEPAAEEPAAEVEA